MKMFWSMLIVVLFYKMAKLLDAIPDMTLIIQLIMFVLLLAGSTKRNT